MKSTVKITPINVLKLTLYSYLFIQTVPDLGLTMMRKPYTFSRNGTSDFECGSSPRLPASDHILAADAGQRQQSPGPAAVWAHTTILSPSMRYSVRYMSYSLFCDCRLLFKCSEHV